MTRRTDVAGTLLDRRELTPTSFRLRFALAQEMARPLPGQFVMIRPEHGENPFWRRAFSVSGFDTRDGRNVLELMIKAVGPGTALWRRLPPGTPVEVLGPLGNGFSIDRAEGSIALVSGGIGLPPLAYAVPDLQRRGCRCDLFLGAASAAELIDREGCRRLVAATGGRVIPATDDGSAGEAGLVTEVLERRLAAGERYDTVLACGPMPMLRALAAVTERWSIRAEFALEERMACGVGVCLGCILPTADGGHLRVCREGPVVEPARIDWESL